MAVSQFLVENTPWPSPSPTRHPGVGLSSEVPGEGLWEGIWARLLAGRKCRCLSPVPHSGVLPSRKGKRRASLGDPLGPRAT